MTILAARMLRQTGCKLPFLIYHDGSDRNSCPMLYDDPHTHVIDITACPGWQAQQQKGGWESKTFALIHSGFAQPFFLDADAYPVADLTPVFEKPGGFCFWADIHNLSPVRWRNIGLAGRKRRRPRKADTCGGTPPTRTAGGTS